MSVVHLESVKDAVNGAALGACAECARALRDGEGYDFVAVLFRPDGTYRTYGMNPRADLHRFIGVLMEAAIDAASGGAAPR